MFVKKISIDPKNSNTIIIFEKESDIFKIEISAALPDELVTAYHRMREHFRDICEMKKAVDPIENIILRSVDFKQKNGLTLVAGKMIITLQKNIPWNVTSPFLPEENSSEAACLNEPQTLAMVLLQTEVINFIDNNSGQMPLNL